MSENPPRTFWSVVSRLLLGGVAVAAVVLFVLYLSGLFGASAVEPAVSEDDLPSRPLLETEGGQHFPGARFEVMVPLADEEGEIQLYTAQHANLPQTVEAARALGERFGLENPTVYETASESNRWIVMEASGRNITFRTDNATLEGIYYTRGMMRPAGTEGGPLAEADAEAAAIAFLEQVEMLPEGYETEVEPTGSAISTVSVIALVDGLPLLGDPNLIEIGVGPDGTIIHARISLLQFESLGESAVLRSAEDAFDELVNGTPSSLSYSFQPVPGAAGQAPRFFSPPPPAHVPGEHVKLSGWMNVLVPVSGGERRVTFSGNNGGLYYLRGPAIEQLALKAAQDTLVLEGEVGEAAEPGAWTLTVTQAEQQEVSFECVTGRILGTGEAAVLESEAGERYQLAYGAEGLESGARAEVCAPGFDDEAPVQWLQIASPPTGELAGAGGGGGGSSVAVESVQEVPVERTVSSGGDRPSSVQAESGSGSSESGGGVAAVPAEQPSPFQVGEIVEVTGIVEGVIYVEDGVRSPEVQLRQEEYEDGQARFFIYPLLGDRQLLEEIAEENRLHVRVTGQVVPRPEGLPGTHAHALVVESFERVYPGEELEAFLGHAGRTVVGGEEIPIFTDAASNQQYALNFPVSVPGEQQVWVVGVVDPERTIGNLPLLRVYESRSGDEVEQANAAGDIEFNPGMPVVDRATMGRPSLQGTLVVEQVVLGYKYRPRPTPPVPAGEGPVGVEEPVLLEPTWFFSGQTEDGLTSFEIEVPATAESGGGRD